MSTKMLDVEVYAILIDKANNAPVMILKEKNGTRFLPIWIGFFEAESIMMAMKGVVLERPLTHDLCSDTICLLGGKLKAVHIHDLRNGTFYARLVIEQNGNLLHLDARPSDAVSLALRQSSPILVSEKVMTEAGMGDLKDISSLQLEDVLKDLPDEAFGKYKM